MNQIGRTPKQIGAAIHRERRRRGLTQEELGSKVRLRQATVSNLEGGSPAARLQTLLDILGALDLEIVIRPRTRASTAEIEDQY